MAYTLSYINRGQEVPSEPYSRTLAEAQGIADEIIYRHEYNHVEVRDAAGRLVGYATHKVRR